MKTYTFIADIIYCVDAKNEEQARRRLSDELNKLNHKDVDHHKGEIRVYFGDENIVLEDTD